MSPKSPTCSGGSKNTATNRKRWWPSLHKCFSTITHLAGVVTLPRQSQAAVSQIEFVGLSDNRVLTILVVGGREVQNRILHLERHYSPDELRRAANYLNEQVRGRALSEVRADITRAIARRLGRASTS